MLNYIKRWHRKTVGKIAATLGLPEDLSHHHRSHTPHQHVNKAFNYHHNQRVADWHEQHNQRVADWHARHATEVMAGTSRLYRWERFVYKNVSRIIKVAKSNSGFRLFPSGTVFSYSYNRRQMSLRDSISCLNHRVLFFAFPSCVNGLRLEVVGNHAVQIRPSRTADANLP